MLRIARASVTVICVLIGFGDSALAQPLIDDASVYYSFDSFVDEVPDESGHAIPLNGDVFGRVSMEADGVRGSSAFFDSAPNFNPEHFVAIGGCEGFENPDACDEIPPDRVPSTGYTVAAWVNLQRTDGDQSIHNVRSGDGSFAVHAQAQGNGQLRIHLRGQRGSENIAGTRVFTDGNAADGEPWPENTWFHYAATYDQPNDVWAMYYNGQAIAGGATNFSAGNIPIGDWGGGSTIGITPDRNRQLFGKVDEFYIFTRAVTAEEIERLFSLDPVSGDTNADGQVNIDDLNNVRNNFGAAGPDDGTLPGDAVPFDGLVNIDDLNGVRNNFGAGTNNVVPEPATVTLLLIAASGIFSNGCRTRRDQR